MVVEKKNLTRILYIVIVSIISQTLICFSCLAQNANLENINEVSIIDVTPAELENILEELITAKRYWLQNQVSYSDLAPQQLSLGTDASMMEKINDINRNLQLLLVRSEFSIENQMDDLDKEEKEWLRIEMGKITEQLTHLEKKLSSLDRNSLMEQRVAESSVSSPPISEIDTKTSELDSLIQLLLAQDIPDAQVQEVIPDTVYSIRRDTVLVTQLDNDEINKGPELEKNERVDSVFIYEREVIQEASFFEKLWPLIHFASNSVTLDSIQIRNLNAIAEDFDPKHDKIIVTGYASQEGGVIFNQRLSAQRAEAVSKILQELNIDASKIQTLYGGIDYSKENAAAARRVEVRTIKN